MALIIKIDLPNLKELEEIASPKTIVRAITRTFNKLGAQAKTATTRKIRETYNIKSDRLGGAITTKSASYSEPVYTIRTKEKSPGLQHYGAKQSGKGAKRKTTVLVKKDKGRKTVMHGFMAPTPAGQIAVWKRTGDAKKIPSKGRYAGTKIKREPIKRLLGPSVVGMMNQVGIEEINKIIAEKANKIWAAQLDYEFNKK